MENWTEIHKGFEKEHSWSTDYQNLWKSQGFDYQTTKEWKAALGENFKIDNWVFCAWLKKENYQPEQFKNKLDSFKLLWWQSIHPDFTEELRQEWIRWFGEWESEEKKENNVYQATQDWIAAGLDSTESQFAKWLENKNEERRSEHSDGEKQKLFQPTEKEQLKQEYLSDQWAQIHPDFAKYYDKKTYQQKWEENGLTCQDAQNLIPAGFKPDDYDRINQWKIHNFTSQEVKSWLTIGLDKNDAEFANYLRWKGYQPNSDLNWKQIQENGVPAQEYLDCFYPQNQRSTIKELNLYHKNLTNSLDLAGFINLEKLTCSVNKLTSLKLNNCLKLERVNCNNNNLQQDLSFLRNLVSLEELDIGNNPFYGSLEPLEKSTKLKKLDISNTDIDNGVKYLPNTLSGFDWYKKKISYSSEIRPQSKIKTIKKQLDSFSEYGKCSECQQINAWHDWCQSCILNFSQKELIEKCQLKSMYSKWEVGWIPYEKLMNIEYLAEGGFGKVYKAKWWKYGDLHSKTVVLKNLNNSQNMTIDFLHETINYKLFIDSKSEWGKKNSHIVPCHGISWNPTTKSYLMVMEYMEGGNLRDYLKKNTWLGFRGRLRRLSNIAAGLNEIHKKELIHRDFHSGNILSGGLGGYSYITDLGLCRPADETSNQEKVYGVLPYMAPEVLQEGNYTQAADVYSFGMVAYELFSGLPPYLDLDYNTNLALKICGENKLRPDFQIKIPQLLEDLIAKCWDAELEKRPTANELEAVLNNWYNEVGIGKDTEFCQQCKAIEKEYNKKVASILVIIPDPKKLTSKLFSTKEITRLLRDSGQIDLEIPTDLDQLNLNQEAQQPEQISQIIQPTYNFPSSSKPK